MAGQGKIEYFIEIRSLFETHTMPAFLSVSVVLKFPDHTKVLVVQKQYHNLFPRFRQCSKLAKTHLYSSVTHNCENLSARDGHLGSDCRWQSVSHCSQSAGCQ